MPSVLALAIVVALVVGLVGGGAWTYYHASLRGDSGWLRVPPTTTNGPAVLPEDEA